MDARRPSGFLRVTSSESTRGPGSHGGVVTVAVVSRSRWPDDVVAAMGARRARRVDGAQRHHRVSRPPAMSDRPVPVSVVVLTYNEERNLSACLETVVGWAAC